MDCISPSKRHCRAARLAVAAKAVLSQEPALLQNIVCFIPVTSTPTTNTTSHDQSKTLDVLLTIVALCRAIPELGRLLDPAKNDTFWRALVMSHFDFTIDPSKTFNVRDCCGLASMSLDSMHSEETVESEDDENDDSEDSPWERHPAHKEVEAWNAAHPKRKVPRSILRNDLSFWPSIGAYFRPTEFQFLSEIQAEKTSISAWPPSENGFTLYCDLLLIQTQLSSFGEYELQTWSDGDGPVYPCLLGRLDAELTKRGCELLRHCGILPHYWWRAPSTRWTGFDGPAPEVTSRDDEDDDRDSDEYRTKQERSIFPITSSKASFTRLCRIVFDSCSDWRRVHCNQDEDASPEFYIGPTKRSGRWIGFVGESGYNAGGESESEDDDDE